MAIRASHLLAWFSLKQPQTLANSTLSANSIRRRPQSTPRRWARAVHILNGYPAVFCDLQTNPNPKTSRTSSPTNGDIGVVTLVRTVTPIYGDCKEFVPPYKDSRYSGRNLSLNRTKADGGSNPLRSTSYPPYAGVFALKSLHIRVYPAIFPVLLSRYNDRHDRIQRSTWNRITDRHDPDYATDVDFPWLRDQGDYGHISWRTETDL